MNDRKAIGDGLVELGKAIAAVNQLASHAPSAVRQGVSGTLKTLIDEAATGLLERVTNANVEAERATIFRPAGTRRLSCPYSGGSTPRASYLMSRCQ